MGKFDMDPDYNEVKYRIVEFRTKYPEGTLQPADPNRPYTVEVLDGQTYIVVVAAAYRTAEDTRPGIGMAYECFPGKTPYTKGSELMNAETSAWGRAIVAVGAADTSKSVASATEVRNRKEEQERPLPPDPLLVIKKELAAYAAAEGHDAVPWLKGEFYTWSQGAELSDADVPTLTRFRASLIPEPTTRVRRSA